MDPNSALAELGKQIGLEDLKLDENGVCRLIFDHVIVVDIEASDDQRFLTLLGKLCDEPPESKENFFKTLLTGSCFGLETGGAAFCLHDGEAIMWKILDMEKTDYQDFVNDLESFVNHQQMWMERLGKADFNQGGDEGNLDDLDDSDTGSTDSSDGNMTFIRA